MEQIEASEFFKLLSEVKGFDTEYAGDTKSYYKISTDGMDYYQFSRVYVEGFGINAGYDCDTFFCKVKTMTKAEIEELEKIFC